MDTEIKRFPGLRGEIYGHVDISILTNRNTIYSINI